VGGAQRKGAVFSFRPTPTHSSSEELVRARACCFSSNTYTSFLMLACEASGTLSAALACVKEAGAPLDQTPDDLKNGLLSVLVDCSLAQAQHITIRRAQVSARLRPLKKDGGSLCLLGRFGFWLLPAVCTSRLLKRLPVVRLCFCPPPPCCSLSL